MVYCQLCVPPRLAVLLVLRAILVYADDIAFIGSPSPPPQLMLCGGCCQSVRRMLENFLYLLVLPNQNVLSAHLDVCLRNSTSFVMLSLLLL